MITPLSSVNNIKNMQYNSSPSFGMAKLNMDGRNGADIFGYQKHDFLDQMMFKKPSIFDTKSRLAEKLEKHADFVSLCELYGCSKNGLNNAKFIENQVFNIKSEEALSNIPEDIYKDGMLKLYYTNFDNPNLSKKSTNKLLESVKDFISIDEYFGASGILKSGTVK